MSQNKIDGYTLVNDNVKQVKQLDVGLGSARGSVPAILSAQTAVGAAFASFTTAKSVLNGGELVNLPANYFAVGKKLRLKASGALSNIITTPGTVSFQVMIGNVIAWTSGAIQLNAAAHTLLPFTLELDLRCDSIGASTAAKLLGIGTLCGVQFTLTAGQVDGVNTASSLLVPATAPAVGTGFDSTVAQLLDFYVAFSISNAGNAVQIYDYTLEETN